MKILPVAAFLLAALPLSASVPDRPVDYVQPLIGSDRARTFFMTAAARPFGMVKLAPDTEIAGYWHTGYQNAKTNVFGFSHLHEWRMGGLPVMPVSGKVDPVPGPERWKSPFDPKAQTVTPGYHRLHLTRYGIDVELTATRRVGFHRYTFNRADEASVIMPLTGVWCEGRMFKSEVKRTGPDTLEGSVVCADGRLSYDSLPENPARVFFVIQTDRPLASLDGWRTQESVRNITEIKGENRGLVLNFGSVATNTTVQMKVAISYCSVEQARLNLTTELPGWDFEAVRASALDEWNKALSRIEVEGKPERKIKFYTDLWHSLLGRGTFSDVNGRYPIYGTNGVMDVKSLPLTDKGEPAFPMHVSDAFWWTHYNLNTLWGLAYPDVLREFCNSWLRFYDDTGVLPLGATAGRVDQIMSGSQSIPLLARAVQMNLPGVDFAHAFTAMKAMQTGTNRWNGDVETYAQRGGYLPADVPPGKLSITFTVENAWCDWVLGQVATKLGATNDALRFTQRSLGWTNLFNPATGWLQPRNSDGTWVEPSDPLTYNQPHCLESYPALLTWFPVHDLKSLERLMGGREATVKRLEDQFEKAAKGGFRYGWTQYSNNSALHLAHLFNLLGDPVRAQRWVREVHTANYSATTTSTTAYCTNDEDQGQMGSLSVLMTMGLFAVRGGCEQNPSYELTAPMFDRVRVLLQPDCYEAKELLITAAPDPDKNPYIKSVTLNGKPLKELRVTHEQIRQGAHLDFILSPTPIPDR